VSGADAQGYRRAPTAGVQVRSDIVEAFVFAKRAQGVELLLLKRATPPLAGAWQPVLGHMEQGESAAQCLFRELAEEIGLTPQGGRLLGVWAIEGVQPYYVPQIEAIVLSPRFVVEAAADFVPTLNDEHGAWRWTRRWDDLLWPSQRRAWREALERLIETPDPQLRDLLRVQPP